MSATPRRPLLRRVPVGGWAALIWYAAAANGLRGYSGLPGMPQFQHLRGAARRRIR